MKNSFTYWIIATGLLATGTFWLYWSGVATLAIETDHFYVVRLMLVWFVGVFLYLGYIAKHINSNFYQLENSNSFYEEHKLKLTVCWFTSSALLTLGLIGTVVGFIAMLMTAFIGKNFSDPTVITTVMSAIGSNWASALFATATGLICSLVLSIVAFIVDYQLEETHRNKP